MDRLQPERHADSENAAETRRPELIALAECLSGTFQELDYSVRAFARSVFRDAGSVSRYLSGQRMPPPEFINELLVAWTRHFDSPAPPETIDHIRRLYHRALNAASGPATLRNAQSELSILRSELESMRVHATEVTTGDSNSYWSSFTERNALLGKFPSDFIDHLARVSSGVIASLPPVEGSSRVRVSGIIKYAPGHGKGLHCAAVIARGLDAGYKLVIVFAGLSNVEQMQTAEQLSSHLSAQQTGGHGPLVSTNVAKRSLREGKDDELPDYWDSGLDASLAVSQNMEQKVPRLLVLKQNAATMHKVVALTEARDSNLRNTPTLIVDLEPLEKFVNIDGRKGHETALFSLRRRLIASLTRAQTVSFADPFQLWETDPAGGRRQLWPLWGMEPDFIISALPPRQQG